MAFKYLITFSSSKNRCSIPCEGHISLATVMIHSTVYKHKHELNISVL